MYVDKLIITPISKGYTGFVRHNPSKSTAAMLMKERLGIGNPYDTKIPKVLKKLPKKLNGWINPNCIVIK